MSLTDVMMAGGFRFKAGSLVSKRRRSMKIKEVALVNVLIPLAESSLPKPTGRNYEAHMLVRVRCDNGLEGIGEGYHGKGY